MTQPQKLEAAVRTLDQINEQINVSIRTVQAT